MEDMSQHRDPSRHDEDAWWQRLYGTPERPSSTPRADSLDEHFATVRKVMGDGDDPPDSRHIGFENAEQTTKEGGLPPRPSGRRPAMPPEPSTPAPGGASGQGEMGRDATFGPEGAGGLPGQRTPNGPPASAEEQPASDPLLDGASDATGDDANQPAPGRLSQRPANDGQDPPGDRADTPDAGERLPSPSQGTLEKTAEGRYPAQRPDDPPETEPTDASTTFDPGPSPTLRLRTISPEGTVPQSPADPDPGTHRDIPPWMPSTTVDEDDEPPTHLGDRPPTYDAQPTAWPAADPRDLDALTPDTVLDGGRCGPLTVRAVSIRGDSARYRGQPRRDALLTARFGDGQASLLVIAVACGVRAATDSHRAARDACRAIATEVGRHSGPIAQDLREASRGSLKSGLHRLTDRCINQLHRGAEERGYAPQEYAADLGCLLLPVDPQCRTRVFFGIGEGGLFRLRGGEWQDLDPNPRPPATPARDPRISPKDQHGLENEPGRPRPSAFRFHASIGLPGDVLVLCTEGMTEPLRGEPAFAALLADRWSTGSPPGLVGFLRDAQVRVKGYADDRTTVGVWER